MKILVVHRQKEVFKQVKSVLRNNPIIRFSDSGLDGLLAARIEWFDLIICGTDLPVITGFEMIRSLRTYSANKNTSVVFIADNVTEAVQQLSKGLGSEVTLGLGEVNTRLANVVNELKRYIDIV